ncbi:TraM recognition domain-containing protein [Winogradskyella sp. SYSU M77433]|uniref:type IV secretory system conjugative DNA transfer family protein n=1 Tax=Winogradskyella sp. SYSU M77433 TaxID=3042722 RepID=UPI002480B10C|nr:TraM recognition domain-containing protein [Winogradskyella sp. SYSU M77433]MDH7913460.1 TraM recognition domain-containing protein [Winogradskyella sp. SYSU M77433]
MVVQNDHLDRVIWSWTNEDFFQVRDASNGIFVSGGLGSGKTSAVGNLIAGHYMRNGFGFLVLTAKENEKDLWIKYCRQYGREKDLVVFSPNSGHYFNFFEEELLRNDNGKAIAHNIADVLMNVIKSGTRDSQESDKAFWDSTLQQLIVNAVDLCLLTKNRKFEHVYKIIQSAPRSKQELQNADWRISSKCFRLIEHTAFHLDKAENTRENIKLKRRLQNIEDFFLESWIHLSEKTRSIVEQMFFGFGDRFMREPLRELFSLDTTIRPEDTFKGKIIIIDLPVLIYDKTGRDAQVLWKYLWQRAIQRRKLKNDTRPVCLWVDEFQNFINPDYDIQFQSIAREYRACTVYMTQNLPNFYLNAGGGEIGKTRFKALAGNLGTKFFLANSDPETNEYASELIGKDWKWSQNEGLTFGEKNSSSQGRSEIFTNIVEPSNFTRLKTGGPENDFMVQAYVHRQGKTFKYYRQYQNGELEVIEESHKLIHLKQNIL